MKNKKIIGILVVVILIIAAVFLVMKGEIIPGFSACGRLVDSDGNSYQLVKIGDQCWSAENMKSTKDAEGNEIIRHCYGDEPENCEIYGGLYGWETASALCPEGWRLPGDDDWSKMEVFLGMDEEEVKNIGWRESGNTGDKLKSEEQCSIPGNADCGISGFQALTGGYRNLADDYFAIGSFAYFWSSSDSGPNAWSRYFRSIDSWSYRSTYEKDYGFSVRCIKEINGND